ncbi:hypothetical protein BpHYR1_009820 [Brachionus plicatilis]|uniref:Uncharacterized protein n=1 Tax=Brachionus plicatilis TaxID=10195 RepID=A0A3M7RXD3_BRAPC|nr:hypothetical protein BpHYR1_009820 [Brachionus plicatilis]
MVMVIGELVEVMGGLGDLILLVEHFAVVEHILDYILAAVRIFVAVHRLVVGRILVAVDYLVEVVHKPVVDHILVVD